MDLETVYVKSNPSIINMPFNFCDFRNVTLQDGTTKPGLILQFSKMLWFNAVIFDIIDNSVRTVQGSANTTYYFANYVNRWKYSYLRNWLNSSGEDWFSPSHPAQNTPASFTVDNNEEFFSIYGDVTMFMNSTHGFLDYLPEDLVDILQPVRVQTIVDYNENNNPLNLDEPDYIDGEDVDVTFDKIFIPSLSEMNLASASNIEGAPWQFYVNLYEAQDKVSLISLTRNNVNMYEKLSNSIMKNLNTDITDDYGNALKNWNSAILTRTSSGQYYFMVLEDENDGYNNYIDVVEKYLPRGNNSQPAPAFVIC